MALKGADPALEGEIMGSYRRGKPYSSDIDYVVRHKDFDGVRKRGTDGDCCPSSLQGVAYG